MQVTSVSPWVSPLTPICSPEHLNKAAHHPWNRMEKCGRRNFPKGINKVWLIYLGEFNMKTFLCHLYFVVHSESLTLILDWSWISWLRWKQAVVFTFFTKISCQPHTRNRSSLLSPLLLSVASVFTTETINICMHPSSIPVYPVQSYRALGLIPVHSRLYIKQVANPSQCKNRDSHTDSHSNLLTIYTHHLTTTACFWSEGGNRNTRRKLMRPENM